MGAGGGPRFAVRADDGLLGEDLARSTRAARVAVEPVIEEVLREGVPFERDEGASKPALVLLAVGERHPAQGWKPSV